MVEYKIAQRKAVKEYKNAKKQLESKLARDKTNPKGFYAYARAKSKVNGQLVSEKEEMCNLFNEYFGSVFTSENSVNELPEVKCFFNEDKSHILSIIVLTRDITSNKLSKLKVNKAPGVDGIVPRLLVQNADILNLPSLYMYKKSMDSGRVPNDWKKANVMAILKKVINHHHVITDLLL